MRGLFILTSFFLSSGGGFLVSKLILLLSIVQSAVYFMKRKVKNALLVAFLPFQLATQLEESMWKCILKPTVYPSIIYYSFFLAVSCCPLSLSLRFLDPNEPLQTVIVGLFTLMALPAFFAIKNCWKIRKALPLIICCPLCGIPIVCVKAEALPVTMRKLIVWIPIPTVQILWFVLFLFILAYYGGKVVVAYLAGERRHYLKALRIFCTLIFIICALRLSSPIFVFIIGFLTLLLYCSLAFRRSVDK